MQFCLIVHVASIASLFPHTVLAGGGEHEFLSKRPGLNQDVQLWNAFLRSEGQVDGLTADTQLDQGLTDDVQLDRPLSIRKSGQKGGAFLDSTIQKGVSSSDDTQLKAALQSCLKVHFSAYLTLGLPLPLPAPGDSLAAVAAVAAARLNAATKSHDDSIKDRLQACMQTTQSEFKGRAMQVASPKPIITSPSLSGFSKFGSRTKDSAHAKPAFVATDFHSTCTKRIKKCKKDVKNCKHVLDILQFLRLQNIAVEQVIQREAARKKKGLLSLKSVLEKHGLAVPQPEDWDWADSNRSMLIQIALENDGLALLNQDWKELTPALSHPLPTNTHMIPLDSQSKSAPDRSIPTIYHLEKPQPSSSEAVPIRLQHLEPVQPQPLHHLVEQLPSKAMPVRLQRISTECTIHKKQNLDNCRKSLDVCKVEVDNLNAILNSIAQRALNERARKLDMYINPENYQHR